jgi:predicted NAD/FAD-dependent oxidoreductase
MEIQDLFIVGAGLTGLSCAHSLSTSGNYLRIQILEKSNGCGGRMATRRVAESKFDHGAQFIKVSQESSKLIDFWLESKVACNFPSEYFEAICGQSGMTQLAKIIAAKLNVRYNSKVIRLEKRLDCWR